MPNPIRPNHRSKVSVPAHPIVTRATPFAIFIASVALSSLIPEFDPPARDLRWLSIFRDAVIVCALAYFWPSYGELRAPGDTKWHHWLLALVSGLAVFVVWIHFDHGWAVIGQTRGFDPTDPAGGIEPPLAALRLLGFALVVPVMEELFWRSFLLRWLDSRDFIAADPRRASPRALALSTALFASEHSLWFAGLIAGLTYNWIYVRTRNLWIPIASHAMTNGALGIWILATRNWALW
ncbi:MAG: CAAX prenyl protease-related protein [Betaproteobacteria bacterium]|nr:MAG: CAAX prenyl protease-related protein [Betaproteobacteria bacterium]